MWWIAGATTLLFLSGCLAASPFKVQAASTPEFHPEAFFSGVTHGEGTLVQHGKSDRKVHVIGVGSADSDGTFRLVQTVTYDDGTTEKRTWLLHHSGKQYTAALSDASGAVDGETDGNVFRLRYLLRQPAVYMDQELYLQSDGRTVLNIATVSVLGVPWARLSERITRPDSVPPAR
ncbi:MAG: DUF3833 family protein [Gemmatimonadaceae bacterium]